MVKFRGLSDLVFCSLVRSFSRTRRKGVRVTNEILEGPQPLPKRALIHIMLLAKALGELWVGITQERADTSSKGRRRASVLTGSSCLTNSKNKIILLDLYYLHESKVLRAIDDDLMVFQPEPRGE